MFSWLKKTPLILALGLISQSYSVTATECNFIKLLNNKSPGSEVLQSKCIEENTLSIANQLSIAAGGRLWLQSGSAVTLKKQVICQNRSLTPIRLEISELQAPWISTPELDECNTWTNNRLNCEIAPEQKFFCLSAELKLPRSINQKQERTTSVSMRNLKPSSANQSTDQSNLSVEDPYIHAVISGMQNDLDLCRQLFESKTVIEMFWVIKPPKKITDLTLLSEEESEIGACMRDVVANFSYPNTEENISFAQEF